MPPPAQKPQRIASPVRRASGIGVPQPSQAVPEINSVLRQQSVQRPRASATASAQTMQAGGYSTSAQAVRIRRKLSAAPDAFRSPVYPAGNLSCLP